MATALSEGEAFPMTTSRHRLQAAATLTEPKGPTAMTDREPVTVSGRKTAGQELEAAAREGLLFITKAFRGAVNLEERENRALLSTASSVVGNWAKYRQSTSAMEATQFAMATVLAKDAGGRVVDMMKLTMPAHRVTQALTSGDQVVLGDGND